MRRSLLLPILAAFALLLVPAAAQAHERWASPTSTLTSGPCLATSPCAIDYAVNGAVGGEEVILAPGTYAVATPLEPREPITLQGEPGAKRPRLVGASTLTAALLTFGEGGTLRHVALQATAFDQDALTLSDGSVAEDVLLGSATGDGAKIIGSPDGTLLRDAVVRTDGSAPGLAGLKLREAGGAGDVKLRNVTVIAPNGAAVGIRCEVKQGSATLVNTLVRGAAGDIDAHLSNGHCSAEHSSFRADRSAGVVAGAGNQESAPLFRDAAAGDYRPAAGSPTIDAGIEDGLLGSEDPAGCPRAYGSAPDIGAYEYVDASEPCAAAPAEPVIDVVSGGGGDEDVVAPEKIIRGVPAPVIGVTVVVAPGRGKVRVRRPGSPRFRELDEARPIPVGSVVDATDGRLHLVSSLDSDGRLQGGTFWGGRFAVRQDRRGNGMTSLVLRGGDFSGCREADSAGAVASAASRRKRRVRRLWGSDRNGLFRTYGHDSVATTRGTRWLTVDRCDGTLTRVRSGAVVVRDRGRGKKVVVKAGQSYLARTKR